jgi:hypothetical protein
MFPHVTGSFGIGRYILTINNLAIDDFARVQLFQDKSGTALFSAFRTLVGGEGMRRTQDS